MKIKKIKKYGRKKIRKPTMHTKEIIDLPRYTCMYYIHAFVGRSPCASVASHTL